MSLKSSLDATSLPSGSNSVRTESASESSKTSMRYVPAWRDTVKWSNAPLSVSLPSSVWPTRMDVEGTASILNR